MQAFVALADPIRARIIEMLARDDLPAGDIAAAFAISRPAVSRHLKVLLRSGLVRVREDAQRRIYGLDPEGLDAADAWIEAVQSRRLDPRPQAVAAAPAPEMGPDDIRQEVEEEPWRPLARRMPLPRPR